MPFPPNIHNIKCYYVSKELVGRGDRVTWIQLGPKGGRSFVDGLEFITVPIIKAGRFTEFLSIVRMVLRCYAGRIHVGYIDEWLFFRKRPMRRLELVMGLKFVRAKAVLDQRDPFIDFELASGWISSDSTSLAKLRSKQLLLRRLSDLVILPSMAYRDLLVSEGFPEEKVLGMFRGIDTDLFTEGQDSGKVREKFGLRGKFVIGWFGIMHPHRLIREVIIPMIEKITQVIPNAHVMIGGEGPLQFEFDKLAGRNFPLSFVGMVAYDDLPRYIAACDVLLCPVDGRLRFSNHSAWLKIPESLAVGKPVIASETMITRTDFKDMKGIVWVPPTLEGFINGLREVSEGYPKYLSLAREQAKDFGRYSTKTTLVALADELEGLAKGSPRG